MYKLEGLENGATEILLFDCVMHVQARSGLTTIWAKLTFDPQ